MRINDPFVFYSLSALLIGYLIYTMVRKRQGLRAGQVDREPEL